MPPAALARPSIGLGLALAEDAWLVGRCRAGEEEAWRVLVDRHSRGVYAIAKRGFRLSEADAEDVFPTSSPAPTSSSIACATRQR
jgi:hypothetical protein